ncbi:gp53-like domain-containing protein [Paraburkholderia aspalathi]|uniref:gp53-like domain-containing protein n=1 Tax=Paraburkholderia aspalathi TaxID=1324617 RepID=UPI003CB5F2F1
MANLVETARWEDGVYQFETSDPVMGGPDGVDNRQAKQLANRTVYLKAQQEAHAGAVDPHPQYQTQAETQVLITAAINALVAAAPGALDTLKELATALGNDPNFATTMTNALALKAPLDSPTFSGTPKVPTQAVTDNSLAAASTAFVNALVAAGVQSGGKVSGVNKPNLLFNGSGEFGNAGWQSSNYSAIRGSVGEGYLFSNTANINSTIVDVSSPFAVGPNVVLNLSGEIDTHGMTAGHGVIDIQCYDASMAGLGTIATAYITPGKAYTFVSATGTTPAGTAYVSVRRYADTGPVITPFGLIFRRLKVETGNAPSLFSHEASIAALASLFANAQNPYIKFPNGLILQWGVITYIGTGYNDIITLPIAFPNGFLGGSISDGGNGIHSCAIVAATKTTITACGGLVVNNAISYQQTSYRYFVVGC